MRNIFKNNDTKPLVKAISNAYEKGISTLRDSISRATQFDTNKDYFAQFGWRKYGSIGSDDYWQMAHVNPFARFATKGMAHDCWANGFELVIKDGEEELPIDSVTDEMAVLARNGLFRDMERADIMNRINTFSIAEVVVGDGLEPDQPIGTARDIGAVRVIPYREEGVEILRYENDVTSPRYGMPLIYQAQIISDVNNQKDVKKETRNIHWSRVILFNEGQEDSNIEGRSVLEPIFNYLIDLDKAMGGSAEAYYANSRQKLIFELMDKEFDAEGFDKDSLKDMSSKFINDMQNTLFVPGLSARVENTPHASPMDTVKVNLWGISAGLGGVPVRMFATEGSGQLAGAEDKLKYGVIIDDRQDNECSRYVFQLMDILSNANLVNLPANYQVKWPKEEPTTQMQQAELAKINAETLERISTSVATLATTVAVEVDPLEVFNRLTGQEIERSKDIDIIIGRSDGNTDNGNTDGS